MQLKTCQFDPEIQIRKVSIKIWNKTLINGIRMTDDQGNHLVNLDWTANGVWVEKEIPSGYEIIGLRANIQKNPKYIPKLALRLWKPRVTSNKRNLCRTSW